MRLQVFIFSSYVGDAWTVLRGVQIVMTDDQCTRIAAMKVFQELTQCCFLLWCPRVGGISRAGSVAHPQPSNVPPARSRAHLPQSGRPDNKSLVLQNKSRLSRDKWLLFSIKRQLFCKILLS
jgi:hypothetical protein